MPNPPLHIVLRYGRAFGGLDEMVEAHSKLIGDHGAVWFGKIGRPFGRPTIEALVEQASEAPTFLFLAARLGPTLIVHRGQIDVMQLDRPDSEPDLVPDYYLSAGLMPQIGTWIRLTALRRDSVETLRELIVAKTSRPILSVLTKSLNAMFIVTPTAKSRLR